MFCVCLLWEQTEVLDINVDIPGWYRVLDVILDYLILYEAECAWGVHKLSSGSLEGVRDWQVQLGCPPIRQAGYVGFASESTIA